MKNRYYTRIENGTVITPTIYWKQRKIHRQLREENARIIERAESWKRRGFCLDAPPLLIRLHHSAEGIPAGVPIQAPYEMATALIRLRAAIPVADFNAVPVLVISEADV